MNKRMMFRDGLMTFDQATVDSTGAFLIGELERLDQTLHAPLTSVTWSRDIDLREDVSIADETSSFTNSAFAAAGGTKPTGKSWIGKDSNSITGIQLDIAKTPQPLFLWGMEVSYTIPELESAIRIGRPIDVQKYEGLKLKHQMDIDEMVYIGDAELGRYGLVNQTAVTHGNVAAGAAQGLAWTTKTPDEIVADITTLCAAAWKAAGYALYPTHLLLPPAQYAYIASIKVSTAGNETILSYIEEKVSMCLRLNGKKLEINPVKWLAGAGASSTDRMVAYTKEYSRIRFPLVPLQRTPMENRSIWWNTTYFGRLGCLEVVYNECIQYADGI